MKYFLILSLIFSTSLVLASETVKGAKEDIKTVKSELNSKLNDVDKEITELTQKAKDKGKEVTSASLDELKSTRKKIASQIDGLKEDSKQNWKELKSQLANSIEALSRKAQKALKN